MVCIYYLGDLIAMQKRPAIRVAEMFAGVGGFRLALDGYRSSDRPELDMPAAGPFKTVWANQWEPPGTEAKQFAWRCYEQRFGLGSCINRDINTVLDDFEALLSECIEKDVRDDPRFIPDFDLLVGGFPCQDYSVAKPLPKAGGIEGKKSILWWDIYRMLKLKRPKRLLLENVDRLLKSPSKQRGRDFAIILSCLNELGYSVEWRVINAADYGMPQRRRRVFIYGELTNGHWNLKSRIIKSGVLPKAFPVSAMIEGVTEVDVSTPPHVLSESFGISDKVSVFQNSGSMQGGRVLTAKTSPLYDGEFTVLSDIVVSDDEVPESFFIDDEDLQSWEDLRAAKKISRTTRDGFSYTYSEGAMPWPDPLDRPARTILTGEGGSGASRMKHAIKGDSGRYRRLVPDELDQIQMFPKGWTDTGMTDGNRAFCMGNALVVGIPHRIGEAIASRSKANGKKEKD